MQQLYMKGRTDNISVSEAAARTNRFRDAVAYQDDEGKWVVVYLASQPVYENQKPFIGHLGKPILTTMQSRNFS